MTTDTDTGPAPEIELAETSEHTALDDIGREAAPAAEPAPDPAPAAPAPQGDQPAASAETPANPAVKPESEQPFWYRQEAKKLRQRAEAAEREAQQLRQQQPQPQRREDDDPDRPLTRREVEALRENDRLIDRLERSEERFTDKHGEESFEATREWLATRPDIEEWALKQRDPWKAAHGQFQKERLAAEIGEDPNAWRTAERERIRQEVLAEIGQEREPAPRPAPQMRPTPPPPASTVRSAAPRDDGGRFTGPAPLSEIGKNRFG